MLQEPLLSPAAPAAIPRRCRELQRPAALIALLSTVGGILAICAVATRRLRAIGDGGPAAWEESPTLLKLQGTPQMMQMLARDMQTAPTIMRQLPPSGVTSVFSAAAATADAGGEKLPVVILHGMGDSGSNPGMQSLCQTVRDAFPGIYVVCSNVANGLSSITTPLADQVDEFAQSVRADERLANGFHSIGLSQGGLVLRGYVQQRRASDPKVCPLWQLAPYTARLAFADYWKDPSDPSTYLERSRWLADINNERDEKKESYKANMIELERYVLVEATQDSTVVPHQSETHGFYAWGDVSEIETLRESKAYLGDYVGLRTLDESGRLFIHQYDGDHLRFTPDFWSTVVLSHLG